MRKAIAAKAKPKYKEIIGRLPEFEKAEAKSYMNGERS